MRTGNNKTRNCSSEVPSLEGESATSLFRHWTRAFSRRFNFHSCWRLSPSEYSVPPRVHPRSERGTIGEQTSFADVTLSRCLGAGGSGTVYLATLHNQTVAVKIVDCTTAGLRIPESFMSRLSHQHLVRVYSIKTQAALERSITDTYSCSSLQWDTFSSESFTELTRDIPTKQGVYNPSLEAWIMMEYCDQGSLSSFIQRRGFQCRTIDKGDEFIQQQQQQKMKSLIILMKQIAEAMVYLHKSGVVHADLKSQNVFLKTSSESPLGVIAKIGDFGNCRQPNKKGFVKTMSWGTIDHMPPEVLRDNEVRFASDVFSFGMILWECMTGARPFSSQTSSASILMAIVEGYRPEIPSFVPRSYAMLIQDCWHQDWRRRPNFKEIQRRLTSMLVKSE